MKCFVKLESCSTPPDGGKLFVFVFFPADIANLAGEPTRQPVSEIRYGVFGTAAEALGLWSDFEVFNFDFGHTEETPYSASKDDTRLGELRDVPRTAKDRNFENRTIPGISNPETRIEKNQFSILASQFLIPNFT